MEPFTIQPLTELYLPTSNKFLLATPRWRNTSSQNLKQTIKPLSHYSATLEQPYIKRREDDPDLEAHYAEVIQQGHSLGLFSGEKLIGIAIAEKRDWNRQLWVWEFHIDPTHQEKGHGRRLMDALADVGKQSGCRAMVCETQNTNVPAIDFYRRVGFEVGAIDLSYYTNNDLEDFEVAVFMKRHLI